MWTAPATGQAEAASASLSKPPSGRIRHGKLGKKGGRGRHRADPPFCCEWHFASRRRVPPDADYIVERVQKAELKNMQEGCERLALDDNAGPTRPARR